MLISLRQCAEALTELQPYGSRHILKFLFVEPCPLPCHSFYNKMLHISDCLLVAGDNSCPSDCTLVYIQPGLTIRTFGRRGSGPPGHIHNPACVAIDDLLWLEA